MSLLDDLEKEAARLKLGTDEAVRHQGEMQRAFHAQLEPGLDRLREFLEKLVANLKLLQPRIAVHYPIPGYGDVTTYIEHNYAFEEVRKPSSRTLKLTFACPIASNECALVAVVGSARVRSLAGTFHRHRIGGMVAPEKNMAGEIVSASFQARGKIESSAIFHADSANAKLRMSFENIDGLGTTLKAIPAEAVDEALFDEIGRYLMGEPNGLFREELPEKYRRQLRQKVQHEQLRRHWETRVTEPLPALPSEHTADDAASSFHALLARVRDGMAAGVIRTREIVGEIIARFRKNHR